MGERQRREGGSVCREEVEGRGRGTQCHAAARDAPLGSDLGADTWRVEVDELAISGIGNHNTQLILCHSWLKDNGSS